MAIQRVAVLGCIGAGKSTLARFIGETQGLPVIHLDRAWWQDGSYRITGPETVAERTLTSEAFRELQRRQCAADRWVMDGGIEHMGLRLARADTVIVLDLPPLLCAWRVARRTGRPRADYPPGVTESWRWGAYLARWVLFTYPRKRRPRITKAIADHAQLANVVWLRSRGDVRRFRDSLLTGT